MTVGRRAAGVSRLADASARGFHVPRPVNALAEAMVVVEAVVCLAAKQLAWSLECWWPCVVVAFALQ